MQAAFFQRGPKRRRTLDGLLALGELIEHDRRLNAPGQSLEARDGGLAQIDHGLVPRAGGVVQKHEERLPRQRPTRLVVLHGLLGGLEQHAGDEAETLAKFFGLAQDVRGRGHLRGRERIEGMRGSRRSGQSRRCSFGGCRRTLEQPRQRASSGRNDGTFQKAPCESIGIARRSTAAAPARWRLRDDLTREWPSLVSPARLFGPAGVSRKRLLD